MKCFECQCCLLNMFDWDYVAVHPEPGLSVNIVKPQGPVNGPRKEPPLEVKLDTSVEQGVAFLRLWDKRPPQ